jgi:hypothetical protein
MAVKASDRPAAVATLCFANAAPSTRGHAYSSYERKRISASVRGTSMPNSCGGAYWQAYRHSPQL